MAERADERLIILGKRLVRAFFLLYKTAGNYAPGHPALSPPAVDLAEVVRELERLHEEANLVVHEDALFLGDCRLKPDASGFDAFYSTVRVFKCCGIGSAAFTSRAGALELERWFVLLREVESVQPEDPCGALQERMAAEGVAQVVVDRPAPKKKELADAEGADARERSKAIYSRTLDVISEVMDNVKLGKALRLKRAKRVVQTMIDQLLTAESNLLGLTNLRCYDEYTYNHSVNVGILTIAIGQRVGYHKNSLVDLGMAAIFHDIGKSCIPIAILNKPSSLDDREWSVMRRHPVLGVKELLKLKGLDVLSARIMQGAFEHHLFLDGSGYPKVEYPQGVSLSGRIIAIADCYDALTSARVYRRTAETPDATLRYILQKSGTIYDPVLAKLFANALGVYPAGTLCQLSTRELAVVVEIHPDPAQWNRPRVKIIADEGGDPVDGNVVDLADPAAGRRIAQTLDARAAGIDVARYFL